MDGNQGKGVTANIDNADLVRTAYELANDYTEQVIVEKYIKGKDYRILVVGDRVAAAAEREPPYVTGDGIHTISELVAEENRNPVRGTGHSKPLTRIRLDTVARNFLERSGYRVNDIPQPGEHICLRENGNLSTGGSARDCTARVHPDNMELAVKAAQIIGLDVAGIDVVMDDISQPLTYRNGAIIEINAAPGLRMHLYPREGQGRNVAADIVDFMYPQGKHPTIPVVSITGTNGKTTVTRLISHTLALAGYKVGMTCSSGTYIGQECISQGDNTGPASARLILYNREVEAAVLETARGGIVRKGVGYDLADVGVITNINDDHLGQDDINTVEDLAFAKALVVEAVKPTGYAVLNADDKMTDYILPRVKCGKIFFAQNRGNTMVVEHIKMGGTAIVVENEAICLYKDNRPTVILSMDDIPITFEGKAVCNIENSLAAVASLIALGVPAHTIRLGLRSFRPIPSANAGRFNLFEAEDFRVLLDYGHNSSGNQSVLQFISLLEAKRLVGVIGMPGDRLNQAIYNVGRLAGQVFHKIYIKEDEDLRGRTTGEVADILYHGVIEGGASKESIEVVLAETEALKAALANALPGDLVVMFYEHFEPAFALVKEYIGETTEDAVAFWPCPDTFKPDFSYIPEVLH
jgi:cyanophycin synthetase